MKQDLKGLGETLRGIKEAASWSWVELAGELAEVTDRKGPSAATLSRIASGRASRISASTAEFLEDALRRMVPRTIELWKASETAREESERRLAESRSLLDNARDIVFRFRILPDFGFDFVSRSVERIVGYTPEEYYQDYTLGFRVLDDEGLGTVSEHLEGRGFGSPSTLRWKRKDGRIIWVEELDHPVFDAAGRLAAIEGIARDVSGRKALEDRLAESEQIAHALINAYTGIALLIDAEGTVLATNPGMARRLDRSVSEVLGRCVFDFYPADIAKARRERADQVIRSGRPARFVDSYRPGSVMDSRVYPVMDESGKVTRLAIYAHDITELTRTQEALEEARRNLEEKVRERTAEILQANQALETEIAQRREAEKGLLAYETQLRAMALETSLAEEKERRRIAAYMHDNVGQTLAVARMKVGALNSLELPSEVRQVLEEMNGILGLMIDSTRSLIFDLSPPILYELGLEAALETLCSRVQASSGLRVSFSVEGDRVLLNDRIEVFLYQAVRELLLNVRKHSMAGKVVVAVQGNQQDLVIRVEDDGVGFSEMVETSGSRYGLFHIKERLRHLGGEFSIQSESGQGTSVVLSVPLQRRMVPE